jgi:hypothetical protein
VLIETLTVYLSLSLPATGVVWVVGAHIAVVELVPVLGNVRAFRSRIETVNIS